MNQLNQYEISATKATTPLESLDVALLGWGANARMIAAVGLPAKSSSAELHLNQPANDQRRLELASNWFVNLRLGEKTGYLETLQMLGDLVIVEAPDAFFANGDAGAKCIDALSEMLVRTQPKELVRDLHGAAPLPGEYGAARPWVKIKGSWRKATEPSFKARGIRIHPNGIVTAIEGTTLYAVRTDAFTGRAAIEWNSWSAKWSTPDGKPIDSVSRPEGTRLWVTAGMTLYTLEIGESAVAKATEIEALRQPFHGGTIIGRPAARSSGEGVFTLERRPSGARLTCLRRFSLPRSRQSNLVAASAASGVDSRASV